MFPQFNSSTGVFEGNVFHVVTDWSFANIQSNGLETYPSAVDGSNVFNLVLKLTSSTTIPKVQVKTPTVHTFKLTSAQMSSAGFNASTKVKITIKVDGTTVPDFFWVVCCCHLVGDIFNMKLQCSKYWSDGPASNTAQ